MNDIDRRYLTIIGIVLLIYLGWIVWKFVR